MLLFSCNWWQCQIEQHLNDCLCIKTFSFGTVSFPSTVKIITRCETSLARDTIKRCQRRVSWNLILQQHAVHVGHIKWGPYRKEKAAEFTSWQNTPIWAFFNFMMLCLILPELLFSFTVFFCFLFFCFVLFFLYVCEDNVKQRRWEWPPTCHLRYKVHALEQGLNAAFLKIILFQCYAR